MKLEATLDDAVAVILCKQTLRRLDVHLEMSLREALALAQPNTIVHQIRVMRSEVQERITNINHLLKA